MLFGGMPIRFVQDLPAAPDGKWGWPWTVGPKPLASRRSDGSEWPKLSIVTPSYNQGKFLEATIRSVLLQNYPNLEYIIIDGGSTDESVEIIRKYEQYLSYWVSEKDQGQTHAINKGLLKTTGDYIGWINSDDLYTKKTFRRIIKAFINQPDCIVLHGNRIIINESGQVIGASSLPTFNPPQVSLPVYSETAFWTRSAMGKVGLLNVDLNFSMDLEFFTRLFLQGEGRFVKLDHYLGYLRAHSLAKSATIGDQGVRETDQLWQKFFGLPYPSHTMKNTSEDNRLIYFLKFLKAPSLTAIPYLHARFVGRSS
jgi:glycosyltransferase involved in cell wall biosynthesis